MQVGSLLAFVFSAREEGKEHLPHAHGNIARHFKEPATTSFSMLVSLVPPCDMAPTVTTPISARSASLEFIATTA